jgi:hypothetical protein
MSFGRQTVEPPKARDDAYTVMLIISLLAMIGACVILYYDLKRFPSVKPDTKFTTPVQPPAGAPPSFPDTPPMPPVDGTPPAPPGTPPPGTPPVEGAPGTAPATPPMS